MLAETDLNKLERQLSDFNLAAKARQDALEELTLTYGKLFEDYRILRSDYEEEKESREKYKKLARGQDRNPFVLVLIDADGYVLLRTDKEQFEDSLIKGGAEGGVRAANILQDTIRDRLSRRGHEYENCKVMVCAYTNLAGLSKTLARTGLVGREASCLSPFYSNFTRAQDLFDLVDAGDEKENADNKIRKMFRLFVENNQCKYIFFAGCHDTGYLNLLTPYISKNDKITLVRGSSFSSGFNRLGLGIDNLNGLFHNNPLHGLDARRPTSKAPTAYSQTTNMPNGRSGSVSNNPPVCTHYLRGICKFGSGCKKSHNNGGDSWRSNEHISGRGSAQKDSTQSSFFSPSSRFSTPTPSSADVSSPGSGAALPHNSGTGQPFPPPLPPTHHEHPSTALPTQTPENANLIPVNKAGQRLDFLLPTPSSEDWRAYNTRIAQQGKLCNEYKLKGYCTKGGTNCIWDHSPVPDNIKLVTKQVVHSYPCTRRGNCRRKNCNMGHICFREKCSTSKSDGACKLKYSMHDIDPAVAEWVPAEPDVKVYKSDSFGMISGETSHSERNVASRAASEAAQNESDIDLHSYAEPHPYDLD
ncbi:unnamed protein product [Aureobasidium vineae]|uniref:C3H1-type domain-containing protein n=1 Tax=Aureobasidium vineae TaxID=2773715 RepID=A0A9N8J8Z0_9PEZI|nr:unnamed protein product [Aureobasidium vineae]